MKSTNAIVLTVFASALMLVYAGSAVAQHSDVEFKYDNNKIDVEFGSEGRVFEGEFPTSGPFDQFTDDPGFVAEDGDLIAGDLIDYNIFGPLEYHDGTGFAPVTAGVSIIIDENPSGSLVVDDLTTGPISGSGVIGEVDDEGGLHSHIDFTLTNDSNDDAPPFGAYGLLMELTTDRNGIGNSDPFYLVFNFGLDEEVFEGAVGDFASQIPEPATIVVAGLGGLVLLIRRRGSA